MRVNEFVMPSEEDKFSDEDIAKVINAEVNSKWVTRTAEELIAHTRELCGGSVN